MAIYRFSFDDKYAGHTAIVTNSAGNAVSGSPITLDTAGDGTLDLTTGIYQAQVDNTQGAFGDGYSVVGGELDLGASLDAAGSGGGVGAILVGDSYTISSNGFTPPGQILHVPWDDTGDLAYNSDPSSSSVLLPTAGIYAVAYELDFNEPLESWRWFSQIVGASSGINPSLAGDLLPGGGHWTRSAIFGSGVLRVSTESGIGIRLELHPDPAAETPTLPVCSFGELTLTRII